MGAFTLQINTLLALEAWSSTTAPGKLAAPANLRQNGTDSNGKAILLWDAVPNASGYRLLQGGSVQIGTGTATTYAVATGSYQVQALGTGSYSNSNYSAAVQATAAGATPPAITINSVALTADSTGGGGTNPGTQPAAPSYLSSNAFFHSAQLSVNPNFPHYTDYEVRLNGGAWQAPPTGSTDGSGAGTGGMNLQVFPDNTTLLEVRVKATSGNAAGVIATANNPFAVPLNPAAAVQKQDPVDGGTYRSWLVYSSPGFTEDVMYEYSTNDPVSGPWTQFTGFGQSEHVSGGLLNFNDLPANIPIIYVRVQANAITNSGARLTNNAGAVLASKANPL